MAIIAIWLANTYFSSVFMHVQRLEIFYKMCVLTFDV